MPRIGRCAAARALISVLLYPALLLGCAGSASRPVDPAGAAAPAPGGEPADPGTPTPAATRYRIGDFVVYEYSGTHFPTTVRLREQVLKVDGPKLTIEVTAARGDEQRTWIQVVTDTPENRENEVCDELYEVRDGERIRLANENNADIYRLYEWIVPPQGGKPTRLEQEQRQVALPDGPVAASCSVGEQPLDERTVRFAWCMSEDFLWTNVGSLIADAATEEAIYRVRVVEVGRRPGT